MRDFSANTKGSSHYENDWVVQEGMRHLRYSATSRGLSEIRLVPALEHGNPVPMFKGPEPVMDSLSGAFCVADMVAFFGPGEAFMICPPPSKGETVGPVHHFVRFITEYVESHPRTCPPDWRRWQGKREDGDTVKPKDVLSRPSKTLFMQGYLIRHRGERLLDREGKETMRWPVVLTVRASGLNNFMDNALEPEDPNAPWGPWNNKLGGDLVDLAQGMTTIVEPYDQVYNNRQQTWYRVRAGEAMPLTLDDAKAVWAPWENVLDITPDLETLGMRMVRAFNAHAVVKAYEQCPVYRQMLTPDIRDMARDEEGATYSTGAAAPIPPQAPALPHRQAPTTPPPPPAPPATQGAWVPPEPPAGPASPFDGADSQTEPAPPTSPAESIRDRVSNLRNRLERGRND